MKVPPERLAEEVMRGDHRSAARLITLLERGSAEAEPALNLIRPAIGHAHIIGLTGPPGSGKSTLIGSLIRFWRPNHKLGVLAIDPSSPRSGGALLGDRARLLEIASDSNVFVRSMSARGESGGMAPAAADAVDVLDAMGCDIVLIETVGGGQADVSVAGLAQTVLAVLVPGLGDDLQFLKAGVIEVADVLVVNKSDLPGAEEVAWRLRTAVAPMRGPRPPVLMTVATTGEGVEALAKEIAAHRKRHAPTTVDDSARRAIVRRYLLTLASQRLLADLLAELTEPMLDELSAAVLKRELSASQAARKLLGHWRQAQNEPGG